MKIGILTLPLEVNYGGNLQAFALQKVLRDMGHEVLTIDRHKRKKYKSLKHQFAGFIKRLLQHYVQGKNVSTKWNPFLTAEDYKALSVETQKFIDRNIKLTRRIYSDQLPAIDKEYQFDAYVVGSDQVWLDAYCPNSFLDFVKREDVIKVIYAASCGRKSFFNNPSKVLLCKDLVKDMKGISVREDYLVTMCREYLNVNAQWVLDPTMLLSPQDYLTAVEKISENNPILFSYVLDASEEKEKIISSIASELQLPIVNGNRVDDGKIKMYPSVDKWIRNINRAQFVITDSFHGTVFSILFNKPFISIGNAKRGMARFESLLKSFDLEERLIVSDFDLDDAIALSREKIDFIAVNEKLNKLRDSSLSFLRDKLNR